ncbi:conjugal transfer protein TraG N-terminal domain-containing protein [Alteromonas macleodii]|uniref:conjugal transfer protein TraG N-terminal domain-containing protein n=1 Tax=Alteromonas macleodii TaxID=28108 RepID=UPI0031401D07
MRLILTLCLFVSLQSFADTTINPPSGTAWEMFVLGGGGVFFDLFNAVKLFVDSSAFTSLIAFFALLGFLVLMTQNVGQLDPKKIGAFFVLVWFISYITNDLKVNIQVIDSIAKDANSTIGVPPVEGVPAAIGLPAAWVSTMGEYFTEMIEVSFNHPDPALKFTNTKKLNMEAQVLKDLMAVHPFSPELTKSLSAFYTDCVYPLIATGSIDLQALVNSNAYMDSIVAPRLNAAITTVDFTDGGAVKGCKEAWETATTGYNAQIAASVSDVISRPYNMHPDRDAVVASGTLGSLTTAILSNVTTSGASTSASDIVKNRALTRSFDQGNDSFGRRIGQDGDLTQLLIEEQAIQQQKSGWRMAIEAFNSMSAYIFTVLHAFIIGISPIMLVLAFIPGLAGKILLNYFQVLFWLALWQPMLSIVNYIVVSFQNEALRTSLLYGDTTMNLSMAAPSTWSAITEAADKYVLAAGFLGTMVPMISWGLVKGGMAFSQFIASGIGTSVAQGAAKNLATGTMSMDNKSFNNTSGNSFGTQSQHKTGISTATHSQIFGSGANVEAYTARNKSFVGDKEQTESQQLANKKVDQQIVSAGASVTEGNTVTENKMFQDNYQRLKGLREDYNTQKSAGITDEDNTAFKELKAFETTLSKMDDGAYLKRLNAGVNFSQDLSAGAMLLSSPVGDSGISLEDRLKSGAVTYDDAYDHYMDKYKQSPAVRQEAERNGWSAETAAGHFANTVTNRQNIKGSSDKDEYEKAVGGSAMLSFVSSAAQLIPKGGKAVSEMLPEYKAKGKSAITTDTTYSEGQRTSTGNSAKDAVAIEEGNNEKISRMENFLESKGYSSSDLSSISETDSTAYAVAQQLQESREFRDSITDAREYTRTRDFTTSIAAGELDAHLNSLFGEFDKNADVHDGTHMKNQRDPSLVQASADGLSVNGTRAKDLRDTDSKVEGASPKALDTKAKVAPVVESAEKDESEGGRTFDFEKKAARLREEHQKYSPEIMEGLGKVHTKADGMLQNSIAEGTYKRLTLHDEENSASLNGARTPLVNRSAEVLDGLRTMSNEERAQGEAYLNAASGGEGSITYAPLTDQQKAVLGSQDQFTASHVQFTRVDGEGGEGIEANVIYSGDQGGLYEMDDKGNMKRLEETATVNGENGIEEKAIYAKDVIKSADNQVSYEEYGKDINGETLYIDPTNKDATPMTVDEIEELHSPLSTADNPNSDELTLHMNENQLENSISPEKLNNVILPDQVQDLFTDDNLNTAVEEQKYERLSSHPWNHSGRS